MKFPFFASFIILCLVVHRAISRNTKLTKNSEEEFWKRENEANEARRKSLDTLNYVTFSASALSPTQLLDSVSQELLTENPQIGIIIDRLNALEKSKMVNLNYVTNTQLKAAYGVANLSLLTEYDQNYTDFITILQEDASILAQNGLIVPALTVLEMAISSGTDISASYSLAASIYKEQGQPEKIGELIAKAEALTSPRKNAIVRMLNTVGQDNG